MVDYRVTSYRFTDFNLHNGMPTFELISTCWEKFKICQLFIDRILTIDRFSKR